LDSNVLPVNTSRNIQSEQEKELSKIETNESDRNKIENVLSWLQERIPEVEEEVDYNEKLEKDKKEDVSTDPSSLESTINAHFDHILENLTPNQNISLIRRQRFPVPWSAAIMLEFMI